MLRVARGRYWDRRDAVGRFRCVLRIFPRTTQAGSIRWPVFLLGLGILVGPLENHFLFVAYDLLAADFHGFDAHHFIAHDADEVHVLRRIAIDPLFVIGVAVFLAHFFRRLALGVQYHLRAHSNQHVMRLNRRLHLRRHSVQVRLFLVSRFEVEDRQEEIAQLLRGHLRDVLIEVDIEIGSVRILLRLIRRQRNRSSIRARDLNVLIPLLAMNGAAVEVEMNVVVLDLDIRDVSRIARPHRRSPDGESLLQLRPMGSGDAVFELDSFCAHGKESAGINDLGLEVTDNLQARLPRHVRRIGGNGRYGCLRPRRLRRRRRLVRRRSWIAALTADKDRWEKNGEKQKGRDAKTLHKTPQGQLPYDYSAAHNPKNTVSAGCVGHGKKFAMA